MSGLVVNTMIKDSIKNDVGGNASPKAKPAVGASPRAGLALAELRSFDKPLGRVATFGGSPLAANNGSFPLFSTHGVDESGAGAAGLSIEAKNALSVDTKTPKNHSAWHTDSKIQPGGSSTSQNNQGGRTAGRSLSNADSDDEDARPKHGKERLLDSAPSRPRRLPNPVSDPVKQSPPANPHSSRKAETRGVIISPVVHVRSASEQDLGVADAPSSRVGSARRKKSTVYIPVYDSGHYTSPGFTARGLGSGLDGGFSASVASLASDMMSFTSPTFSGLRRSGGVVFPRAKRDTGRPPADVGDIAQSTLGSIGTETDYVSNLRRAPVCHIPTATREQEMRRLVAPDPTVDRHGPADYTTEIPEHKPAAIFGTTKRATGPRLSDGPGPAVLMPESSLRTNRATHFGSATREGSPERSPIPGPTDYETEKSGILLVKSPSAHFGTARRWKPPQHEAAPGPDKYGTGKPIFVTGAGKRQPSFGFPTARRF